MKELDNLNGEDKNVNNSSYELTALLKNKIIVSKAFDKIKSKN